MYRQAAESTVPISNGPPARRQRVDESPTLHRPALHAQDLELNPRSQQSNADIEIIDLDNDDEPSTSAPLPAELQDSQDFEVVAIDDAEVINLDYDKPEHKSAQHSSAIAQTSNCDTAHGTSLNVSRTTVSSTSFAPASVPPPSDNTTHPSPPNYIRTHRSVTLPPVPVPNTSIMHLPTSQVESVCNVAQGSVAQVLPHPPVIGSQTYYDQPVPVSQTDPASNQCQRPRCNLLANTDNAPSDLIHVTDSGSMYREVDDGIEIIDSDGEQDHGPNGRVSSRAQALSPAPPRSPDLVFVSTHSLTNEPGQQVVPGTKRGTRNQPSFPPNLFNPSNSVHPHVEASPFSNNPYGVTFPVAFEHWAQQPHRNVHTQKGSSSQAAVSRPMLIPVALPDVSRAVQQALPPVPPPTSSMTSGVGVTANEGVNGGLTDNELQTLVKQHTLTADAEKEAETPSEMTVKLLPHQKRALEWMSKRERPMDLGEDVVVADDECLGGILADEQGLGKTLSMISVMVKNKPRIGIRNGVQTLDDRPILDDDYSTEPTSQRFPWRSLIVCPLSLINQWRAEIINNIQKDARPTVCIYHGSKRDREEESLRSYDIVITTYSTLISEYPKVLKNLPENQWRKEAKLKLIRKSPGPLFSIHWRRAVLDEAHMVKNRNTESWRAVMSLKADCRWCLTGTPIINSVDDIYSLFCFVRYTFVPNYEMWNHRWKKLMESPSEPVRLKAFKRFQTICGVAVLRRTKKDTINGKPLLSLPKREIHLVHCEFSNKDEQAAYNYASSNSMETLNKQLQKGTTAMTYSSVLLILLRLRQACCHPFLEEYTRLCGGQGRSKLGEQYATPYAIEELEETLELMEGQQSLLEMLEDSVRVRIEKSLQPPETKIRTFWAPFQCNACGAQKKWEEGTFFSCGDQFCGECCEKARMLKQCLLCKRIVGTGNGMEIELNANELRMEVHARAIIGNRNLEAISVGGRELREWAKEKVKMHRSRKATSVPISAPGIDGVENTNHDMEISEEHGESLNRAALASGTIVRGHFLEKRKRQFLKALSIESTKIKRILHKLDQVRKAKNGEKTLIFSQWTSMLDIIEFHIEMRGHATCRLDGKMSIGAREAQIEEFKRSKEKNVMLISLRSGGTGLNLTVASHVIMVDVWWNPYVEEQAIDRVHRIGQTRTVHVTKFKLKNTVEERIYAICARKRVKVSGALGDTSAQSLGRQKLSFAELLGIFRGEAENIAHLATPGSAAAVAANNILQLSTSYPHSL